jgi:hypothetical protein
VGRGVCWVIGDEGFPVMKVFQHGVCWVAALWVILEVWKKYYR